MLNRQKPQKPRITDIVHKHCMQKNVNDFMCYEFNIVSIFCECNQNFTLIEIICSLSNYLSGFLCIICIP